MIRLPVRSRLAVRQAQSEARTMHGAAWTEEGLAALKASDEEWNEVWSDLYHFVGQASGWGLSNAVLRQWKGGLVWAATRGPGSTLAAGAADGILARSPHLAAAVDRLDDPGHRQSLTIGRSTGHHRCRVVDVAASPLLERGITALTAELVAVERYWAKARRLRQQRERGQRRAARMGLPGAVARAGQRCLSGRADLRAHALGAPDPDRYLLRTELPDVAAAACGEAWDDRHGLDPPEPLADVCILARDCRTGQSPGITSAREVAVLR